MGSCGHWSVASVHNNLYVKASILVSSGIQFHWWLHLQSWSGAWLDQVLLLNSCGLSKLVLLKLWSWSEIRRLPMKPNPSAVSCRLLEIWVADTIPLLRILVADRRLETWSCQFRICSRVCGWWLLVHVWQLWYVLTLCCPEKDLLDGFVVDIFRVLIVILFIFIHRWIMYTGLHSFQFFLNVCVTYFKFFLL